MDILTQAILGGSVGYALAGQKLGKKALNWGIIGGVIPDLDIILVKIMGPFAEFQYHRGFTHGLVFCLFLGYCMGEILYQYHRNQGYSRYVWHQLMIGSITTHPLLDIFTSYGTQLFWPFTNWRVASSSVSVVDPFYTMPLLAILLCAYKNTTSEKIWKTNNFFLVLTTAYLFWGGYTAVQAKDYALQALTPQLSKKEWQLQVHKTFGQIFLHRVILRTEKEVKIGYTSTWKPKSITWETYPIHKHKCWIDIQQDPQVKLFHWFSGITYPELDAATNTYRIYDLRYGFKGLSNKGFWGITVSFDPKSCRILEPVTRFQNRPDRAQWLNGIQKIYQMAFGGA